MLFDFKGGLYDAGTAILHGRAPYRAGFLARQAAIFRADRRALGSTSDDAFSIPLYPAPANLAIVPLSVVPFWLAGVLFTLTSLAGSGGQTVKAAVVWLVVEAVVGIWLCAHPAPGRSGPPEPGRLDCEPIGTRLPAADPALVIGA